MKINLKLTVKYNRWGKILLYLAAIFQIIADYLSEKAGNKIVFTREGK